MINSQNEAEEVFYMKCSRKEFERLQQLYESGELDELLDTKVIDFGLTSTTKDKIILSQWLKGIIDFNWEIINASNLDFSVRTQQNDSNIICKKVYDLITSLDDDIYVELVVKIQPIQNQDEMDIDIRVRTCENQPFLPLGLKLVLFNDSEILHEVEAKGKDNSIRIPFTGQIGDNFSIKIALGDFVMVEDFTI